MCDGLSSILLSIKLAGYRRKEPTDVRLDLDELALICKVQPSIAAHQESFDSELMFQREVYMYTKLLPALASFTQATSLMKYSNDVAAVERLLTDLVQILNDGLDMEWLGQNDVVSHGDCWINNTMFVLDKVRLDNLYSDVIKLLYCL